jgi:hypothetical protein
VGQPQPRLRKMVTVTTALLRLGGAGGHSDDLCTYGSPGCAQLPDRLIAKQGVMAGARDWLLRDGLRRVCG